jgi:hypothetical protein
MTGDFLGLCLSTGETLGCSYYLTKGDADLTGDFLDYTGLAFTGACYFFFL